MNFKKLAVIAAVATVGAGLVGCSPKANSFGVGFTAEYTTGQATVNAAAVTFDKKGTVIDCKLDSIQVKVEAGEGSEVVKFTSTYAEKSKQELGDAYNMKTYGNSKAEVDVEISTFAAWCEGKTVEEIAGSLGSREDGHYTGDVYTSDDELWASVTITVNSYVEAIEQAWENRKEGKIEKDSTVGLKLTSSLGDSSHLGYKYEVNVDLTAVAAKEGVVQSALMDTVVFTFAKDTDGALTEVTNIKYIVDGKYASKKTIGAKYAMAGKNGGYNAAVTLEWYEQALLIETALEGTTVADFDALAEAGAIEGATITYAYYLTEFKTAVAYSQIADGTRISETL